MIHEKTDYRPADPPEKPSRVDRRRAAKMDAIIEATLELILEEGLSSLTIGGLAKRMDWSMGALYRYFEGKDALLAEAQARVIVQLHRDIERDIESATLSGSPLACVLATTRRFRRFALEQPARFHLISAMLADPRPLAPRADASELAALLRSLLATVDEQLEAALVAGHLDMGDSSTRTVLLWAGLHGLLQFSKLGRAEARLRQTTVLAETIVDDLLRSWGAEPEVLAAAHMGLLGVGE
jgi:AcrR family transcriptional regulator